MFWKKHPYLLTLFLLFSSYLLLGYGKQSWLDLCIEQVNLSMLHTAAYISAFRSPYQHNQDNQSQTVNSHLGKKVSTALAMLYGMSLGAMCGSREGQKTSACLSLLHSAQVCTRRSTRSTHEGQSCSHSVPAMSILQLIICQYILRSISSLFTRYICFRMEKVIAAFSKADQVSSTEIIK